MSDATPESIIQVAFGFMAAKHLFVANEIGLFEALAKGSLTLETLAEKIVVPPRTTRIVADAMVALGFLTRQDELFQNTQVAGTFLSGESDTGLRPFLRLLNRISYPTWEKLEEAVRSDDARTYLGHFGVQEQQTYSAGVEALTLSSAQALASAYDFGRHRRLLDLGGGTGSFLLEILRAHRGLEATLFELPSVTHVAQSRLARAPDGARIEIVAGDFFQDPLPRSHDVVIIANVAHCFSASHNLKLLRRARQHLADRTRLLLVDLWTDRTHTRPAAAPLLAGEFLVICGEGDVYSEDEVRAWLDDTGWRMIECKPLAGPMSLIVAEAVP